MMACTAPCFSALQVLTLHVYIYIPVSSTTNPYISLSLSFLKSFALVHVWRGLIQSETLILVTLDAIPVTQSPTTMPVEESTRKLRLN